MGPCRKIAKTEPRANNLQQKRKNKKNKPLKLLRFSGILRLCDNNSQLTGSYDLTFFTIRLRSKTFVFELRRTVGQVKPLQIRPRANLAP